MRALAAVVALAACAHALDPRALLAAVGITPGGPADRIFACSESLGTTKCISALSLWRAENAINVLDTGRAAQFNLREDVERFPWEKYSNISDKQLNLQLSDRTENLLRYRSLSLTLPGYSLELVSKGNGTLNVDVLKNDEARNMKKFQKDFYNVMPLLLIPGLIMSAVLPFVLPMLKMMVVAVGILNNMALSGAVFTLLRNNAFTDHYEKKVIYVNEGYKNEKFSPIYFRDLPLDHLQYSASDVQQVAVPPGDIAGISGATGVGGDNLNMLQEYPIIPNADWINQYYGNPDGGANVAAAGTASSTKVRRSSKIKTSPFRVPN